MSHEKIARKIIERMREVLVAKKSELVELVKNDINPSDPARVVDAVTKMLKNELLFLLVVKAPWCSGQAWQE